MGDRRLKVLFRGNNMPVSIFLTQVSREKPVLPGGFAAGDKVVYIAQKKQKFKNGDQLYTGMPGEVTGKSTMGDGSDERRVKVKFEGNRGPICVFITEIEETEESLAAKAAKEETQNAKSKTDDEERKKAEKEAKR